MIVNFRYQVAGFNFAFYAVGRQWIIGLKIPDDLPGNSYGRFLRIIKKLSPAEQKLMAKLLLKYPASTRALVGSMFEIIGNIQIAKSLLKTLNPVTAYKEPGVNKHIDNAENWNINDTQRK